MLRTAIIVLCSLAFSANAETLTGYVVGVSDGDTITVLDAQTRQHKIQLQGIDAPEKAQPFGQRSKENLSRFIFNKDVRVKWDKRDRYKRIVGKVWVQPSSCATCPMTLDCGARTDHRWPGMVVSQVCESATSSGSRSLRVLRTGSKGQTCRSLARC